jgi:hypothetical protein
MESGGCGAPAFIAPCCARNGKVKIGRDLAAASMEGIDYVGLRKKMTAASLTCGPEKAATQGAGPQTAREREGRRRRGLQLWLGRHGNWAGGVEWACRSE